MYGSKNKGDGMSMEAEGIALMAMFIAYNP